MDETPYMTPTGQRIQRERELLTLLRDIHKFLFMTVYFLGCILAVVLAIAFLVA